MDQFWNQVFLNNTVRDWAIALAIMTGAIIALRFFQAVIITRIKKITSRTKSSLDDFIISTLQKSLMPILYVLAIYTGLKYIILPARATSIIQVALMLFNCFFILRIITSFIRYLFHQSLSRHETNQQRERQAKGILLIVQGIVWVLGLLFLVDNLGYDITTLVAGLGIGGIAIALAAQTILGDLFSYLVIFFDKPFEVGDFVIVEDKMGTIEYVGIKTTRIRSLSGEQLVCSNTDLTNSRLHNYKRMQERRVVFSFGVVYHTPVHKLNAISTMVSGIINNIENARLDRVHFQSFSDYSLKYEVVYYVLTPDYNIYMDIQQEVNMAIVEKFTEEKIEFALPARILHINGNQPENEHRVTIAKARN